MKKIFAYRTFRLIIFSALLPLVVSCSSENGKEEPAAAASDNNEIQSMPPATSAPGETAEAPNAAPPVAQDSVYEYVEQMPQFQDGEKAMIKFLSENIKYPEAAQTAKVEGIAVLAFVVRRDGSLTDLKVVKDLGYGTSEEAVRVAKLMDGQWEPGIKDGQPVSVNYTLPVRYTIR